MTEIIYKQESHRIIGSCFEVYNDKGCGFLEPVYQECLGIEFEYQRIPAIATPSLVLSYRGRILNQTYAPDYVCFEKIIVELNAVSALTDEHRGQLPNYLHATGFELGSQSISDTIQNSNTNALQGLSTSNQKRIFAIFLFDLIASI